MKTMLKKLLFFMLVLPLSVLAQNTLTGKVTDALNNQVMPGVTVSISGTSTGTITDEQGAFTLKNVKNGDVVSFAFLGYKTKLVTYTNQQSISIALEQEGQGIEEVVVVGYGKVKKKDATGAVTQIGSKDFNKGATPTVENLLNGRVAGVQITTGGGPGSGSAIRIRGGASLTANNEPLIVVDGLPLQNSNQGTPSGSRNFLASIDPSTIESITVLKDAASTAIYGSRASNGVILITTKKGSKKLNVEYNFQYGSGQNRRKIDVLGASEFVSAVEKYFPNLTNALGVDDPNSTAVDNPSTPGIIEGRLLYNTDWQDEIYKRTDYVVNTLNVGGSLFDVIPTRVTASNTYQEGLVLTDKFNRSNFSLALSPSFFKNHLKVNVNANYANERNKFAATPIGAALRMDPTKPVYSGNTAWGGFTEFLSNTTTNQLAAGGTRNPVGNILLNNSISDVNRIYGNVQLDYKFHFLPELRAVVNAGIDKSSGSGRNTTSKNSSVAFSILDGTIENNKLGSRETYSSELNNKLFDGYLNYTKKFGGLELDATAGYSYQKFEQVRYSSGNVVDPNRNEDTFTAPDLVLLGFFGRTNFTLNDKYILSLSYRRDGSSRFPSNEKYGNFPGASIAWKVNKDLFTESKVISDLKLRAGWGITGQQDLGQNDFFIPRYQTGNPDSQYVFGNTPIILGLPLAFNSQLKWEETTNYNAGLDYGLWNDRITGSVDVFYKLSEDLLYNDAPFADGSNFSNKGAQNSGSFTTKGIEFNINADILREGNFKWNVNFNASTYERRIKELPAGNNLLVGGIGGGTGGNIQIFSEGWTPFSYYVYKQLYNPNGTPIEGAFADINGDNLVNENDRYIYKNPDPAALLGFQSSMSYKNLDLSFNMRASIGNKAYNNVNSANAYTNFLQDVGSTVANVPSATFESNFASAGNNVIFSDYYIEDASFLRVDNITLGYTFQKTETRKAVVRITAGIQNPDFLLFTKYSGLDPEVFGGIDNTIYPRQEQILLGVNVKF
ncbi:SusC/RagA family TonB-linked outer membrane protein [Flavobacterium difficile]|uniref:SusC/RagA family TonB-linked outer membrane protein n=1 Tax=Flavobacterium difficile TaxID=2709659 RepID=A0ABX0I8K1_9FLAO|nr:SusC/RagA family TonB-linked outer membrane protein [Flavobacterium difficile]NHM02942.1 SusC/RagA family TonB-linked outer membrane protein [Flavobacterium difficile]